MAYPNTARSPQPELHRLSISQCAEAIAVAVATRQPIMLHGPVGVGKSTGIVSILRARGATVQVEMLSFCDPTDAAGIPVPDLQTGAVRWMRPRIVDDAYAAADQHPDTPHVIVWDEYNRAPISVLNTTMRAVNDGVLGTHPLPLNVCHVAAVNDAADSSGVTGIPEAARNRFVHIYTAPNIDDVLAWGEGRPTTCANTTPIEFAARYADTATGNLRPEVLAYLKNHPDHLWAFDKSANADAFPTPRAWEFVSRLLGVPTTPTVEAALVAGAVGTVVGRAFCLHLAMYRQLGSQYDLDSLIADPRGYKLPVTNGQPDISTAYAIAYGLAGRATTQNLGRILTYVERLPNEWSTLTLFAAVRRDPTLMETPAYTAWMGAHPDAI